MVRSIQGDLTVLRPPNARYSDVKTPRAGAKARAVPVRAEWPVTAAVADLLSTLVASPLYRDREVVADGVVHVLGIAFGLFASASLLFVTAPALPALEAFSLAVYSFGLLAMLLCSASYNLAVRPGLKKILRRLDHSAIFIMIAGTYTPFALALIGGETGFALFAAVWAIAVLGIVHRVFFDGYWERLVVPLYLAQSWIVLVALDTFVLSVPAQSVTLLLFGGVIYTTGVLFHLWQLLPFNKAIWHSFVLVAAVCHFVAVTGAMATVAQ